MSNKENEIVTDVLQRAMGVVRAEMAPADDPQPGPERSLDGNRLVGWKRG